MKAAVKRGPPASSSSSDDSSRDEDQKVIAKNPPKKPHIVEVAKKVDVNPKRKESSDSSSSSESEDEKKGAAKNVPAKGLSKTPIANGTDSVLAKGNTLKSNENSTTKVGAKKQAASSSSDDSSSDDDDDDNKQKQQKTVAKNIPKQPQITDAKKMDFTPTQKAKGKESSDSSSSSESEDEKKGSTAKGVPPKDLSKTPIANGNTIKSTENSATKIAATKKQAASSSSDDSSSDEEVQKKIVAKNPQSVKPQAIDPVKKANVVAKGKESSDSSSSESENETKVAAKDVPSKGPPPPKIPSTPNETNSFLAKVEEIDSKLDLLLELYAEDRTNRGTKTPLNQRLDSTLKNIISKRSGQSLTPKQSSTVPLSSGFSGISSGAEKTNSHVKSNDNSVKQPPTPSSDDSSSEEDDHQSAVKNVPKKQLVEVVKSANVNAKKKESSSSESSAEESEAEASKQAKKHASTADLTTKTPESNGFNKGTEKSGAKHRLSEPFKRVTIDPTTIDPRLRDNSFLAKSGDNWGVKAYQDFQNVRGRNFRHEKTKKKRGSYFGGQIDTSVNSTKFE